MVSMHGLFKDNKYPFPPPGKDDARRIRRFQDRDIDIAIFRDYYHKEVKLYIERPPRFERLPSMQAG